MSRPPAPQAPEPDPAPGPPPGPDRTTHPPVGRPVIIDTDPGTDDAVALFLALAAPGLDVQAITVVGGNVGLARTVPNARAIRGLAGADVPVFAGADRPLLGAFGDAVRVHGADGLAGVALPDGAPAAAGVAADMLRERIRRAPAPLTLVGIGPATNLALALATEPALVARIAEIVLMAGTSGAGNVGALTEFNAASDPEALAIVLGCGAPVTLAPLDLTGQVRVTQARLAALRAAGRAAGRGACLRAACDIMDGVPRRRPEGEPLHDPCAIAWLIAPHLFTARSRPVTVDLDAGPARGRTVFGPPGEPGGGGASGDGRVRVLETADADGVFALLATHLARLP